MLPETNIQRRIRRQSHSNERQIAWETTTEHSLVHLLITDPVLYLRVDAGTPHQTAQLVHEQTARGGGGGDGRLSHLEQLDRLPLAGRGQHDL